MIEKGAFTGKEEDDQDSTFDDFWTENDDTESDSDIAEDEEIRATESKSSFTSSVGYPFSFSEVAFLLFKLYQCADRRYRLRERADIETLKEADETESYNDDEKQLEKEDTEADRKQKKELLLKFNIEKLSRMHDLQLNFVSALSTKNKKRWVCIKNKVIKDNNKKRAKKQDRELLLMRMAISNDMSDFINIEFGQLGNKKKKKSKINIALQDKVKKVKEDDKKINLESSDKEIKQDDLKVKDIKIKEPKKEKRSYSLTNKDALGKKY